MAVVLKAVGLPLEGIGLIPAVDRELPDCCPSIYRKVYLLSINPYPTPPQQRDNLIFGMVVKRISRNIQLL